MGSQLLFEKKREQGGYTAIRIWNIEHTGRNVH